MLRLARYVLLLDKSVPELAACSGQPSIIEGSRTSVQYTVSAIGEKSQFAAPPSFNSRGTRGIRSRSMQGLSTKTYKGPRLTHRHWGVASHGLETNSPRDSGLNTM